MNPQQRPRFARRRLASGAMLALGGLALATLATFGSTLDRDRSAGLSPAPAPSAAPPPVGYGDSAGIPLPSAGASPSASPAAAQARAGAAGPAAAAGWWRPRPGLTWQWQLKGKLDLDVPADVYDLDAFSTSAADVAALHRAGRQVICYVNVGAFEDFRPDKARFPTGVLGRAVEGWPGERWLDIRRWDLLEPILSERFATCRSKGFDAVEPDNVDGYANPTGFPLTAKDQLTFNRRVAELAHRHGLAVGLKNDVEQAGELVSAFDFAVNEECAKYSECQRLAVFVAAGKAVFHAEYDLPLERFCPVTRGLGLSSIRKRVELDAWRQVC